MFKMEFMLDGEDRSIAKKLNKNFFL